MQTQKADSIMHLHLSEELGEGVVGTSLVKEMEWPKVHVVFAGGLFFSFYFIEVASLYLLLKFDA